jgi:hypothetical protein
MRSQKRRRGTGLVVENIESLCDEAADRMKQMPFFHPQFTLHDNAHLLRVTELMSLVLGPAIAELNELEVALLILAAHFHDQGMVPDHVDSVEIRNSASYHYHRELWIVEHPNVQEIDAQLARGGNPEKVSQP